MRFLNSIDVQKNLTTQTNKAPRGLLHVESKETDVYTLSHTIEDGIERIVYLPQNRRFQTPILMQHGMWHGAWCWQPWQELFAEWGWESHAFSLPGHAGSPMQRPIARCTLDYYLYFLKTEVDRLPRRPILMGHSMGGALIQWYLKYAGDLPAAVLVASWVSSHDFWEALNRMRRLDPRGVEMVFNAGTATPFIRTPERAASMLITDGAVYSPEELHTRLGPESGLVVGQHSSPFWEPPRNVKTPMLWLAAGKDVVISAKEAQRSALFYNAKFVSIRDAGHNLMMEHNYRQTAETIYQWLIEQEIE